LLITSEASDGKWENPYRVSVPSQQLEIVLGYPEGNDRAKHLSDAPESRSKLLAKHSPASGSIKPGMIGDALIEEGAGRAK